MREAHVVVSMFPILRYPVVQLQRHSVTEVRHTHTVRYGQRIKQRLAELSRERGDPQINAAWLARRAGIAQSSLYDLISRGEGSAKTATIAHHLGLNPRWLECEKGPRLANEPSQVEKLTEQLEDKEQVCELLAAFALLTSSQRGHYLQRIKEVADANEEIRRDLRDRHQDQIAR